ncbi:MAG: hypothetical protein JSS66_17850 [Armatimonadetes bacterium]|nr:hypothetical protein [Armatimonadota bacterium]
MALRNPAAIGCSTARQLAERARLASCAKVAVYRPFFICGTVTVLTAGCLLGALALWGLAMQGSYLASAWTPYVLAHANSQLYGWVGFFVMGFSLQHHAPTVAKLKLYHGLAWCSLALMGLGILMRFLAEPLAREADPTWVAVGVLSACFQAVAVVLFVTNTTFTRYRPTEADGSSLLVVAGERPKLKRAAWQTSFVFLSLFFFVVVSLAEPFVFALSHRADRLANIQFVAEWFAPLREAQFLGFVAPMVFGVGLSKFSECMDFENPSKALGLAGLAFWIAGLLCRIQGWIHYFRSGMEPGSGTVYFLGGVLLCLGAVFVVASSGVWRPSTFRSGAQLALRSQKFIRAAMVWLLVAGAMMVAEPFVLGLLSQPFSHAYIGAVRHAVTVGFISQMIIGFSARIVPNILGLEDRAMPRLWPTFILLNAGNAARVVLEVATDFTPNAFVPMGVTGFVELIGLALWGGHILSLLLRNGRVSEVAHAK